ncbi:MAG TPA: 3-phosphoglycerate dehydrogenase [Candidatus Gallacutalibacter pullistercoris]|nr:3-phosphoglycerate dehydrogenase [Candidatus Gallacutalibacter pullistercoris]
MYQIHCLNKISPIGTDRFGENYTIGADLAQADAVLVRSAAMHDMELPEQLLAIARAGAGVNNIPLEKCSQQGIVVFNTPGANANAVKELVLCGLLLASRKIAKGIDWARSLKGEGEQVSKLVEKGKSAFVGPEISGKALGVIGLGAIGILVANAAEALGMTVFGYDPYLSVDAAWGLSSSVRHARSLDEIYANCDYITLHLPQTPDTKGMINAEALAKMKDGVRILNFARGGLVISADMIAALENGKAAAYVTDFLDDELLGADGVTPIPHLGASTPESEDNCASMAVDELKDYLENGNIRNSVNMPAVSMARAEGLTRICILHRNVPNTISLFSGAVGNAGVNIENMQSMSRGDYAYTIFDVSGELADDAVTGLSGMEPIIRVRVIR